MRHLVKGYILLKEFLNLSRCGSCFKSFMALEGTHVRFALDLGTELGIENFDAYCSGSVYPDTRYVTRVQRDVTHGPDCPHNPFANGLSDFQRGWASHLLYDHQAGGAMKLYLSPDLGPLGQGNAAWVEFTAMKVVEDLEAIHRRPDILAYLQRLAIPVSPSGEPIKMLQYHFAVISKLYRDIPTFGDYRQWFLDIGASEALADSVVNRAIAMLHDEAFSANLTVIFDRVLEETLVARGAKTA